MEAVFAEAVAHHVALEINAIPARLDLDDVNARRAAELGILLSIDTDAHDPRDLENAIFGVAMARRAGLGAGQVINTWEPGAPVGLAERSAIRQVRRWGLKPSDVKLVESDRFDIGADSALNSLTYLSPP